MTERKIQSFKAYQILAHFTYRDHTFFNRSGDWINMTPATTFCRMLKMHSRDLKLHLEYLKEKGYIQNFTHGRGDTKVQLGTVIDFSKVRAPVDELSDELKLELAKVDLPDTVAPGPEKVFNPHTLEFE